MPIRDHRATGVTPAVADHTHTVRVAAPPDRVWDELSSLDTVLCYLPRLDPFTLDGEDRAAVCATVELGPYRARLAGEARVTDRQEPGHWSMRVDVPEVPLTYWLEFVISPDGAGTRLLLRAKVLHRRHDLVHLRRALQRRVEDHVVDLGGRIASHLSGSLRHRRGSGTWDGRPVREPVNAARCVVPPQRRVPAAVPPPPADPRTGLTAAESRLTGRLRRLLAECAADERETDAYGSLHRLLTDLRHRTPGSATG